MFQSGNRKEAEIHTIVAYELTWCAIYLDSKLEKDTMFRFKHSEAGAK